MHPAFTVLTTAAAAAIGYYVGKTSALRQSSIITTLQDAPALGSDEFHPTSKSTSEAEWESSSTTSSSSSEGGDDDISAFPDNADDCKLVLVVRTDLGMTKGKMAAQCGHATLMCYKAALRLAPALVKRWERVGQTKVAVQCRGGEEELLLLQATAASLGVVARIVHDAGRTQIAAGSATVLGIGPGEFGGLVLRKGEG